MLVQHLIRPDKLAAILLSFVPTIVSYQQITICTQLWKGSSQKGGNTDKQTNEWKKEPSNTEYVQKPKAAIHRLVLASNAFLDLDTYYYYLDALGWLEGIHKISIRQTYPVSQFKTTLWSFQNKLTREENVIGCSRENNLLPALLVARRRTRHSSHWQRNPLDNLYLVCRRANLPYHKFELYKWLLQNQEDWEVFLTLVVAGFFLACSSQLQCFFSAHNHQVEGFISSIITRANTLVRKHIKLSNSVSLHAWIRIPKLIIEIQSFSGVLRSQYFVKRHSTKGY